MFRLLLDSGQEFGILQSTVIIVFFLIFVGVILWAVFAKKKYVKYMSKLPLDEQEL